MMDQVQAEQSRQLPARPRRRHAGGSPDWRHSKNRRSSNHGDASSDQALARGLGWFSIGLGLAEVAAPAGIARFLGVDRHTTLIRALGAREIASGLGILSQPRAAGWLWSRVGGDAIDLALLFAALGKSAKPGRVAASIAAVGGVTLLDALAGDRATRRSATRAGSAPSDGSIEVTDSIAIMATPEEAYAFWRDLENLPRFMSHLRLVQDGGAQRSHWVAQGPLGKSVEWDAEIVRDLPGEEIAWRALEGADVANEGVVRFLAEPAGRGTVIEIEMSYKPPLGGAGQVVATLLGEEPAQQIRSDLRRLKQLLETGEVPTIEGQPSGRSSGRDRAVAGPKPMDSEVAR